MKKFEKTKLEKIKERAVGVIAIGGCSLMALSGGLIVLDKMGVLPNEDKAPELVPLLLTPEFKKSVVTPLPCENAPGRFGVFVDHPSGKDELVFFIGDMEKVMGKGPVYEVPMILGAGRLYQDDMTVESAKKRLVKFCDPEGLKQKPVEVAAEYRLALDL